MLRYYKASFDGTIKECVPWLRAAYYTQEDEKARRRRNRARAVFDLEQESE